jgi:hypothetical protein
MPCRCLLRRRRHHLPHAAAAAATRKRGVAAMSPRHFATIDYRHVILISFHCSAFISAFAATAADAADAHFHAISFSPLRWLFSPADYCRHAIFASIRHMPFHYAFRLFQLSLKREAERKRGAVQ